ncbi:MAG: hypothetical protein NC133_02600 [Prevotella sp.]|nr:hypothetical protein [Prevotella sp.]
MKTILLIIVLIVLAICFGSFPLSILAKVCEIIATALKWLANAIDFFGWNGLLKIM